MNWMLPVASEKISSIFHRWNEAVACSENRARTANPSTRAMRRVDDVAMGSSAGRQDAGFGKRKQRRGQCYSAGFARYQAA